jgi:hypothetical protein
VACRQFLELDDDGRAQAPALKVGMDRHVAQVRAVDAIRQSSSCTDQYPVVEYESLVPTVRKRELQIVRLLVTQWRDSVELRQDDPVDGALVEQPLHASAPLQRGRDCPNDFRRVREVTLGALGTTLPPT